MESSPTAFISYAWESEDIKQWVKHLATRLRSNGIDAKIDQWEIVPGDQMPHFMERSVRQNDYVLIVCTPKYKSKSEGRIGGVGYEGDIMTGEVLQTSNHRKFIPILKLGSKESAIPSWLQGKYFIDLSSEYHFDKNFDDLITTILNVRESAPELGVFPNKLSKSYAGKTVSNPIAVDNSIKIKGILVDEVSEPRNDGTRGSALYKIPFELNKRPDQLWIDLFVNAWNWPPSFSTMHRPGIASVYGNKIVLDGTTIEEVEKYHKDTLKLAVGVANDKWAEIQKIARRKEEEEKRLKEEHRKTIDDANKRMNFD